MLTKKAEIYQIRIYYEFYIHIIVYLVYLLTRILTANCPIFDLVSRYFSSSKNYQNIYSNWIFIGVIVLNNHLISGYDFSSSISKNNNNERF